MTDMWGGFGPLILDRFLGERRIELGYSGILFSSDMETTGTEWSLHSLSGWWEPAGYDVDQIKTGRGVSTLTRTLAPRQVGWTGLVSCQSAEDLMRAKDQFRGMASTWMTVDEKDLGLAREATQVRVTSASVTDITDRVGSFSVSVACDDPLLQSSASVTLDRSASVRNDGDHAAYPLVTVTGPTASGPRVSIGSWAIVAPRALGTNEQMIVNCGEGELVVGGSPVFPLMTSWPSISPGQSVTITADRGTATVKRVSAWR